MAVQILFVILLAAPPVVIILLGMIRAFMPSPPRLIRLEKGRFDRLVHARIQDPTELLGLVEAALVKLSGPERPFESLRATPSFEELDAWNRVRLIDGDIYKGLVAMALAPVEYLSDLGRPVVEGEFHLNGMFSSSLRGFAGEPKAQVPPLEAAPTNEQAGLALRAEQHGETYKRALQALKGQIENARGVSKGDATKVLEDWRVVGRERLAELASAYKELPLGTRISGRFIGGERGQVYLGYQADFARWEGEVDRLLERWDSHFAATETFFDLVLAVTPDETLAADHIDAVQRVRAKAIADVEQRYNELVERLTDERNKASRA